MIRTIYSIVLMLVLCPLFLAAQQQYTLTIPSPLNGVRNQYVETLLTHIFNAQGFKLNIQYSHIPSNKIRTAKLLSQNKKIDLFWAIGRDDINQQLQEIKLPIYNGYIGHRLLLISDRKLVEFSKILNLEQLATYTAVQKKDWLDYKILVNNGLDVEGDITFSAMFKAVEQGLVDYFPRSILEVDRELKEFGSDHILIAPDIMIKYTAVSYFYINKENNELEKIIQNGFEAIIKNGLFEKHFQHNYGNIISKYKLDKRLVIELNNPYFKN